MIISLENSDYNVICNSETRKAEVLLSNGSKYPLKSDYWNKDAITDEIMQSKENIDAFAKHFPIGSICTESMSPKDVVFLLGKLNNRISVLMSDCGTERGFVKSRLSQISDKIESHFKL